MFPSNLYIKKIMTCTQRFAQVHCKNGDKIQSFCEFPICICLICGRIDNDRVSFTQMTGISSNLTYQMIPSIGQYNLQRYSHWLLSKPLWVLYCCNVCENLGHSNHLEKLCNKDSIYTSFPTIHVVVS